MVNPKKLKKDTKLVVVGDNTSHYIKMGTILTFISYDNEYIRVKENTLVFSLNDLELYFKPENKNEILDVIKVKEQIVNDMFDDISDYKLKLKFLNDHNLYELDDVEYNIYQNLYNNTSENIKSKNNNLNINNRVIVISNTCNHRYDIDSILTLNSVRDTDSYYVNEGVDYIHSDDFKLAPVKENDITNEILSAEREIENLKLKIHNLNLKKNYIKETKKDLNENEYIDYIIKNNNLSIMEKTKIIYDILLKK